MHAILTIKKGVQLAITALLLGMFFTTSQAAAQTAEVTPNDQAEKIVEEFDVYTAVQGDNVTELVRRSIIEFDQTNDEIELTAAQVVFAETNIVQEMMCGDVLHVGQEVSVSKSKIENYSNKSLDLATTEIANWDLYAQNASLVLSDRTAASNAVAQNSTSGEGEGSGIATNDDQEDGSGDSEVSDSEEAKDEDSSSSSNWYWWIVGGSAVVGGWHLLGKQRES